MTILYDAPEGFFVTTLAADLNATSSSIPLTAVPVRITTGYATLEPNHATKREVVHFTSVGATTITTTDDTTDGSDATGRGCLGSITQGGVTAHDQGVAVVISAVEQYWARLYSVITQNHNSDGTHKTLTDSNGNEWLGVTVTASAINYINITNAATGNAPIIAAAGDDTNIDISIVGKGTGGVKLGTGTVAVTDVLDEDTMSSNSAVKLATQQSIKAYVDSGTTTFTNKRNTKRVTALTSHATPTINTDNCDAVDITAQAEAITSMTTNLSGTPANKDLLLFEIKDNGTARAITWGASFVAGGVALPTTTVISKILTTLFQYSTANSLNKWRCIASTQEA